MTIMPFAPGNLIEVREGLNVISWLKALYNVGNMVGRVGLVVYSVSSLINCIEAMCFNLVYNTA